MEAELVRNAGVPYTEIPAAGIHGVGWRSLPGNSWMVLKGIRSARQVLRDFNPQVMFYTGGYVAVPTSLAARRVPSALFVPDIEPGLAIQMIARFAGRIAVTAESSRGYFRQPEKIVVTGYPTRADLKSWTREEAYRYFDFSPALPTLLVTGGSKGARSINRAVLGVLPELLASSQVIHLTGRLDWEEVKTAQNGLPAEIADRYRPYPYLYEQMGAALSVADLALSRAGASTLGEYPLFGLPAILVPYPYAWRYQHGNAEYLVNRGAAIIIRDEDLPEGIIPAVLELLNHTDRLAGMRKAMLSIHRPGAAAAIAHLLQELTLRGQGGARRG
jgi:UDP-N-acetylglucosamine--N-acetylmuramyl-(pentapeptide) pyrophosphoryl-undecaprenol N-acetylglucosamine transferase